MDMDYYCNYYNNHRLHRNQHGCCDHNIDCNNWNSSFVFGIYLHWSRQNWPIRQFWKKLWHGIHGWIYQSVDSSHWTSLKKDKYKYKALAKWRNTVYFYAHVLKHRSKNVKIISPKKETLPDIALDKVDIPGMDVPRIPKR